MLRALYTSATGMKAQELLIDNTANNLANVNTTGFKQNRVDFADLMPTSIRLPGAFVNEQQNAPSGLQIGNGVRAVANAKQFSQGHVEPTGRDLDIAIEGAGFFQVNKGGTTLYTRAGNFGRDDAGNIVTATGYRLEPNIQIGADFARVTISEDGQIQGHDSQGQVSVLGNLELATFVNPAGLSSIGDNLFAETAASGAAVTGVPGADGYGSLKQGALENSNVEVVTELISLIEAQRAYEVNSRAIRAGDEMLSTSVDIVR